MWSWNEKDEHWWVKMVQFTFQGILRRWARVISGKIRMDGQRWSDPFSRYFGTEPKLQHKFRSESSLKEGKWTSPSTQQFQLSSPSFWSHSSPKWAKTGQRSSTHAQYAYKLSFRVIYIAWHFEQIPSEVKRLETKPIKKASCNAPTIISDWSPIIGCSYKG